MKIRCAENKDISELKKIWKVCFGDSDEYIDNFFNCLFNAQNTIVAEVNNRVAGVTYMIPAKLKERDFMYGYAIGVLPEFRGRSICKQMLDFVRQLAETKGFIFGLHPANKKLEEFYKRIGLKPMYNLKEVILKCDSTDTKFEISDITSDEIVKMRKNAFANLVEWDENIIDFIKKNGGCVKKITLQQKSEYFFLCKEPDALVICETSADDAFIKLIDSYLKKEYNVKIIKYILPTKTTFQGVENTYIYGFSNKDDSIYMNLFLE